MDKDQTSKPSTEKSYSVSEDEQHNIASRQDLIKQYQYLMHVINMDIKGYVEFVVLKRLGIPEGKNYILSADNKTITLPGGEDEHPKK